MTLEEAGSAAVNWMLWLTPGALGAATYLIGEVSPDGWAEFFKTFGVLGALVFYMGYNMIYREPRQEKANKAVIDSILEHHRNERQEDRDSHKETYGKVCESLDRNTKAFEQFCAKH